MLQRPAVSGVPDHGGILEVARGSGDDPLPVREHPEDSWRPEPRQAHAQKYLFRGHAPDRRQALLGEDGEAPAVGEDLHGREPPELRRVPHRAEGAEGPSAPHDEVAIRVRHDEPVTRGEELHIQHARPVATKGDRQEALPKEERLLPEGHRHLRRLSDEVEQSGA